MMEMMMRVVGEIMMILYDTNVVVYKQITSLISVKALLIRSL